MVIFNLIIRLVGLLVQSSLVLIWSMIYLLNLIYKNVFILDSKKSGFTLIEILVVIAIIGLLSTMAVVAFSTAREAAKKARAQNDLSVLRTGIALLIDDTGKWPNGCPVDSVSNPEVQLSSAQAGIGSVPAVGNQGGGCFWTSDDIFNWAGPYASFSQDPWGNEFYFDPDYRPYENCVSITTKAEQAVIVSFGPNGEGLNDYDCDDIWLSLK